MVQTIDLGDRLPISGVVEENILGDALHAILAAETELRETIRSVFRGKPVERVELFGSAARGGMTARTDLDILVTPSGRPRVVIFRHGCGTRGCGWQTG
jgi:hypothetical protein